MVVSSICGEGSAGSPYKFIDDPGSRSSSCLSNLSVGPIHTGQAVPGLVTLGQQAIHGHTLAAHRAAWKCAACASEDKENMPAVVATLVPIKEPAPVPIPDATPTLILGALLMSLDDEGPVEEELLAGPSTATQDVVMEYRSRTHADTPCPTPSSPPYCPVSPDPDTVLRSHMTMEQWEHCGCPDFSHVGEEDWN